MSCVTQQDWRTKWCRPFERHHDILKMAVGSYLETADSFVYRLPLMFTDDDDDDVEMRVACLEQAKKKTVLSLWVLLSRSVFLLVCLFLPVLLIAVLLLELLEMLWEFWSHLSWDHCFKWRDRIWRRVFSRLRSLDWRLWLPPLRCYWPCFSVILG